MTPPLLRKADIAFFGKLPSEGDFVKNNRHAQLMTELDDWAARAIDQLRGDSHWQEFYDALPPFRFLMLGSRRKIAVGGCFAPSRDSSGRRYPFITAAPFEGRQPEELLVYAPLMFLKVWETMETGMAALIYNRQPERALALLDARAADISEDCEGVFGAFLEHATLETLSDWFAAAGHRIDLCRLVIALGELVAPLAKNAQGYCDRGLLLPLPQNPADAASVTCFWMSLIAPFLRAGDFEVTLFSGTFEGKPRLAIGFLGADSNELAALLSSPELVEANFICLDEPDWVDQVLGVDPEKARLSSYLREPRLSLRTLYETFMNVYGGK